MSQRDMWKMIHLLHLYGRPGLTQAALRDAGIICDPDTVQPLLRVKVLDERSEGEYALSDATLKLLEACVLANKRTLGGDVRVDYPHAFVIMPFSEPWSNTVYGQIIEPAIRAAGLECTRGDTPVRVGDLTTNIWNEILRAGVIIADISVPNVNVFYELGLAHALGKDVLLLKNKAAQLPADFGGAHYYEYEDKNLAVGRSLLTEALRDWAKAFYAEGVRRLAPG